MTTIQASPAPHQLTYQDIKQYPLPHLAWPERWTNRTFIWLARRYLTEVHGDPSVISPDQGPMIVVLNHSQRYEALLAPSILLYYRQGRVVHFMADWQFLMMPVVSTLYRRGETIIVYNKDAKPKFLNVVKRLFGDHPPAFDRAYDKLKEGGSVGVFPEGTVNRDPKRLMRGLPGAAKLALRSGVKVLPIGIRFPEQDPERPIRDGAKMTLHFGEPLFPPVQEDRPSPELVRHFHAEIMMALAELSGKSWRQDANKRRRYVV